MKNRWICFALILLIVSAVFVGCNRNTDGDRDTDNPEASLTAGQANTEVVTDENGEPVTDENGTPVTQQVTDKDGQTESTTLIPYSTTRVNQNISYENWPYGLLEQVGLICPDGWEFRDVTNELQKKGTTMYVNVASKNLLGQVGVTEYVAYIRELGKQAKTFEELSYSKEVYASGSAAVLNVKQKTDGDTLFVRYYIFESDGDILMYTVYAEKEKELDISIKEVIDNTYYRN